MKTSAICELTSTISSDCMIDSIDTVCGRRECLPEWR
jgi:hypothetical protein